MYRKIRLAVFGILCVFSIVTYNFDEKHLTIIVPSYNNEKWLEKNLRSVFMQKYSNYYVIYRDDCSKDKTYSKACKLVHDLGMQDKISIIRNENRRGKAANLWLTIHERDTGVLIPDDSIIVILDGDDWYPHDGVFSYLNELYQQKDIWLTYGGFKEYPSGRKCWNDTVPQAVIDANSFRKASPAAGSQQRTFYAWLYRQIKLEDFIWNGSFIPVASDIAKILPMMEMSGQKILYIQDTIYIYNRATELNDDKINRANSQWTIDHYFRMKQPYFRLNEPKSLSREVEPIDCIVFVNENRFKSNIQQVKITLQEHLLSIGNLILISNVEDRYKVLTLDGQSFDIKKREDLISIFGHITSKYIAFIDYHKVAHIKNIDLLKVHQALNETQAFGFYLINFQQTNSNLEQLGDNLCAWQIGKKATRFKQCSPINGMVYLKDQITSFIEDRSCANLLDFKKKWQDFCLENDNMHRICLTIK